MSFPPMPPPSQTGMTATTLQGTPWNITGTGAGYDANGNPIGQYGNVTGPYTPPAAPTGPALTGPGTPGYGTPKPPPADPNALMTSPTGPFQGWNGWGANGPPAWTDPTMDQVAAQPGFQFGQQQGQQALEQDQAQQGLLYGGGTLKDILAWGQNYATQFYNNTRQNMLNSYQQNVGNWQNAWNNWDTSRNYAVKAASTFA